MSLRFTLKSHALIARSSNVVLAIPQPLASSWHLLLRLLITPGVVVRARAAGAVRDHLRDLAAEGLDVGAVRIITTAEGIVAAVSKPVVVEGIAA